MKSIFMKKTSSFGNQNYNKSKIFTIQSSYMNIDVFKKFFAVSTFRFKKII